MTTIILPFRLKVAGADEFKDFVAISTSYKFQGLLTLEDDELRIQWAGTAHVQEVATIDVRDEKIPLPDEELILPVSELYRAKLAGGWWRPRVMLQVRTINALQMVPSEDHGVVNFWYARSDGRAAADLVSRLTSAIGG